MRNSTFKILSFILLIGLSAQTNLLYSQEDTDETPLEIPEEDNTTPKEKGHINFFVNNNFIFLLSVNDSGFGFGETITFQYTTPFNLAFGLEAGYYGAKSETDVMDGGIVIGGFSLIPLYALAEFNFRLVDNFYISPVVKFGVAYTSARINGWIGGSALSMVFEGGVRVKAFLGDGFLIQGNICYGGLIEKSGLFHMINIGLGFGF